MLLLQAGPQTPTGRHTLMPQWQAPRQSAPAGLHQALVVVVVVVLGVHQGLLQAAGGAGRHPAAPAQPPHPLLPRCATPCLWDPTCWTLCARLRRRRGTAAGLVLLLVCRACTVREVRVCHPSRRCTTPCATHPCVMGVEAAQGGLLVGATPAAAFCQASKGAAAPHQQPQHLWRASSSSVRWLQRVWASASATARLAVPLAASSAVMPTAAQGAVSRVELALLPAQPVSTLEEMAEAAAAV